MEASLKANFSSATSAEASALDGTSPAEVFFVTLFVPQALLLLRMVGFYFNMPHRLGVLLEILVVNLILLLALTSLCNHLQSLFIANGLALIAFCFINLRKQMALREIKLFFEKSFLPVSLASDFSHQFVGGYRGHLLLATCICILGVDFDCFPTRFAKTETYGWSVMDAGVGSFVLVHGLCSPYARRQSVTQNSWKKSLLSSLPLLALGFVRLALTSAVGYHKVIPEYGIHWNFFFTLAFTKILCFFLLLLFPVRAGLLFLSIVLLHQWLLSKVGLTHFVLSDARRNLVEANKEGICSLLGFVALYFAGIELGTLMWKSRGMVRDYVKLLLQLVVLGLSGCLLMYCLHTAIQPVSRRMANLAYCIWVVSLTTLQVSVHLFQDLFAIACDKCLKHPFRGCVLWKAINYNGLLYFLFANLMTGLVNLTMDTEKASDIKAVAVLVIYLIILSTSVMIPYYHSIQFKFW